MRQCIKIKVVGNVQMASYREYVRKNAQRYDIEGTVQNAEDKQSVIILASGVAEKLDEFIDALYKGTSESKVDEVQVEPMIKEKDFRSVFRIIGD